jgi:uncharacterized protein (TIGR02001 family)
VLLRIPAFTFALAAMTAFVPLYAQGIGGSVAVTSDYVYRGVSQTRGEPALQADIHYASTRGWSAGLWASTVELNAWDGRTGELNAYLGYRWQIHRDWSSKISAVHYEYPWNGPRFDYDYDEVVGTLGFRNRVFATVAWSFNTSRYSTRGYFSGKNAISYDVATSWPVWKSLSANAGIGYYDLHDVVNAGYLYWSAGLSYDWRSWRADLSYFGTGSQAEALFYGNIAGDRVAASLSWRF